ncbi:MAG: FecCD family ABC transporter permease [Acidimicrobiales bacterium]
MVWAALSLSLFGLALVSLLVGYPTLGVGELLEVLGGGGEKLTRLAVTQLRLPRLVLAALAGAALAVAGVIMQDSLRNPLAGPELLGLSAGAVTVVAALNVFPNSLPLVVYPWLALGGGTAAAGVVMATMVRARAWGSSALLILVGAAVSALLGAAVVAIVRLGSPNDQHLVLSFLLGSIAGTTWADVRVAAPWLVVGLPLALVAGRPLNLMQLGDDVAQAMGLAVSRTRVMVLVLSATLVAPVIAVCGAIGFVSLLAPHVARRVLGTPDSARVLRLAALVGAVLLVGADLVARQIVAPQELPVGIWTTLLGGPPLLVLLRRRFAGLLR